MGELVHWLYVPSDSRIDGWDDELNGHAAVGALRHLKDKLESVARTCQEHPSATGEELRLLISLALTGRE